jgi:hypothetical protein
MWLKVKEIIGSKFFVKNFNLFGKEPFIKNRILCQDKNFKLQKYIGNVTFSY